MDTIRIKISPEFLKTDIISETYDGNTFGVYSGLSQMLSGGTNGSSLFTGLTIPIVLNQDYHDIGYYSVFDGDISQQNVNVNFWTFIWFCLCPRQPVSNHVQFRSGTYQSYFFKA